MPVHLRPWNPLVVGVLLVSLSGCEGVCTALDIDAALDPISVEDEALIDAHGYFNLVGDCETEELSCQEYLPATCEEACSPGMTCVQVELRVDPCARDFFFPDRDTGDHWIRKCVEFPEDAEVDLATSPLEPSDRDESLVLF